MEGGRKEGKEEGGEKERMGGRMEEKEERGRNLIRIHCSLL